jgi:protein-disulfide isomerase
MKKPVLLTAIFLTAILLGFFLVERDRPSSTPSSAAQATATSAPSIPATPRTATFTGDVFKDISILKPPAGARVAVFEFEDLECPYCARVYPLVRAAVGHYKIPLVRHDFPLTEIHVWSFDAAVTARYLQDNVSSALAEDFRRDIFANQTGIASKEDLDRFTAKWFQAHSLNLPFVMDAAGTCKQEVQADRALGDRLGVRHTPCIVVVTETGYTQVTDIDQLSHTIELALTESASPPRT